MGFNSAFKGLKCIFLYWNHCHKNYF